MNMDNVSGPYHVSLSNICQIGLNCSKSLYLGVDVDDNGWILRGGYKYLTLCLVGPLVAPAHVIQMDRTQQWTPVLVNGPRTAAVSM